MKDCLLYWGGREWLTAVWAEWGAAEEPDITISKPDAPG